MPPCMLTTLDAIAKPAGRKVTLELKVSRVFLLGFLGQEIEEASGQVRWWWRWWSTMDSTRADWGICVQPLKIRM